MYFKYLKITNYIALKLFILIINMDVVSFFNIFSILVYVFRCNISLFKINENFL